MQKVTTKITRAGRPCTGIAAFFYPVLAYIKQARFACGETPVMGTTCTQRLLFHTTNYITKHLHACQGKTGSRRILPSIIIKRTETQTSRLCVFSLLQPHRTEVRLTGKYRYLTFEDRKKIEAWHLLGDRPVDIAARLSVHHTTIYKELQRGATGALDANQREGYSAELAERRLRESFKRRGKRAPAAQ